VQDTEGLPATGEMESWSGGAFSRYLASEARSLIFVSAEAAPYSKTGGLGDVVGSLPVALADRGHRVMVVSPRYLTNDHDRRRAARLHDCNTWVKVEHSKGEHWVNFHHEHRDCVDWVFVEHICYQRSGGLYGNDQGIYKDNTFRFALSALPSCDPPLALPQLQVFCENTKYYNIRWMLLQLHNFYCSPAQG
jgi:starch synthase